jgi:plasmid stability protein
MATLYVENVPDDLYEALRARAKQQRTSIASEVISLLETFVPTEADLKKRREFGAYVRRLQKNKPLTPGPFPSAEDMIREDRER